MIVWNPQPRRGFSTQKQPKNPSLSLRVRKKLNMSRDTFSRTFKIPYSTLRCWDDGKIPSVTSRTLLLMIEEDPGLMAMVAKRVSQPAYRQREQ